MSKKNIDVNNIPEDNWNDIDDIYNEESYDTNNIYFTKNEVQDYDFEMEARTDLSKLVVPKAVQIPEIISFDYIKLKFSLTRANEAKLTFNRKAFMRTMYPQTPSTKDETYDNLITNAKDSPTMTMELTPEEENYTDVSMEYTYVKKKYPNAKPFFSRFKKRMGLIHLYVYNGELIIMLTGKIVSKEGDLGLLNWSTIYDSLGVIKSTGLIDFENEAFIDIAEVLSVHVTNDINVGWVNPHVKAFSSYMPMRTDKYNVLKYRTGYIILQTGRRSKNKPHYEFCIYNKGAEIKDRHNEIYRNRIGKEGVALANKTLRQELRLFNFAAIRMFVAPDKEDGTVTLRELLDCKQAPILKMLSLLEITKESLEKARGQYIVMYEGETFPTHAEFERMQGLIHMLEKHDYNLDKVRSYIEAETHLKTHSTYFQTKRATLQQYITCYKPRTIALLLELLKAMSY